MARFEPCLVNDRTQSRVEADTLEGQQAGVRGATTFIINGRVGVGTPAC